MPDSNASVIAAVKENTKVTKALVKRVDTLADRSTLSEFITRRTRMLTLWLVGVVGFTSLLGFGFAYLLWDKSQTNSENAVQQCENANETRKFNTAMWDYILGHELGDTSSSQAPDEIVMSEQILPRIHYANRPRDCGNLDRKYPMPEIPDPPGGKVRIIGGKAVLVP